MRLAFNRRIHPEAAERYTPVRTVIDGRAATRVARYTSTSAGVGEVKLSSAPSAAQESREQTAAFVRRAPHHHTLHLRVVRDQPPIAFVSVPVDITLVMLAQQHDPVFALPPMAARLMRAAINHARTSPGAAEGIGPGINRIAKHLVDGVVDRKAPIRRLAGATLAFQRG